jgi:TetR/AcrR family transcriptional regulator, transcriptional repressor for nem operon
MRTAQAQSPTKEKILDAAQQLMLAKGFPATTVDEICEAAGFTKGSFFHYFESKEHLGKEVLNRFFSFSLQQRSQQGSFRKKSDPLQRVYGYVDRFIEMATNPELPSGCLLGHFTQELSNTHPEIRSLCAQHFAEWAATFKHDLDEAKAKHAPRAPFDTQSLAEYFIAVMQGSRILATAKQDAGVFERNLQHFKRYIKSLFEK